MSRCIESFELSSEDILSIEPQPHDTCEFNHPIDHELDYLLGKMQDAVAHETLANHHFDVDLDSLHVDKLIDAIAGFDDWRDGWLNMYQNYVEHTLSDDEKAMYEAQISIISDISSECPEYGHSQIAAVVEKIPDMVSEFEKDLEKAIVMKASLQDDLEILESELSTLERELEHADGEDADFIEDELNITQNKIDELQENLENHVFNDALSTLNEFENIVRIFGNPMQFHFTRLRREINNFKSIIKSDLMVLNREGENVAILTYPADYLREQLSGHGREDVTIVAACEETFIERVMKMETAREQLSDEDRKVLFEEKDVAVAVKRFKDDYPEYEQVLWFSSKNDALTLSKREFVSLVCLMTMNVAYRYSKPSLDQTLDIAI